MPKQLFVKGTRICGTCKYFKHGNSDLSDGICTRYAPRPEIYKEGSSMCDFVVWPPVNTFGNPCGDFVLAEEQKGEENAT